jgi:iron complex outermembrane receptor protein
MRIIAFAACLALASAATVPDVALAQDAEPAQSLVQPITVYGDIISPYPGGMVSQGSQAGFLGNRRFTDIPFSTLSITSENMENRHSETLFDAVRDDPTIRYQYTPGSLLENFHIRNFTYNNNSMTLNGLASMAPVAVTAVEFLERVEIQRGPTGFTTGINTGGEIAGNINLVTKHAPLDDVTRLAVDYASQSKVGGHVDLSRRFGAAKEFGGRMNAVYRDGDSWLDEQKQTRSLYALALDYTTDSWHVTLDGYYTKDEFSGAGPVIVNGRGYRGAGFPSPPDTGASAKGIFGEAENKALIAHADYQFNGHLNAYVGGGIARGEYTGYIGGGDFAIADASGAGTLSLAATNTWLDKKTMEFGIRADFDTGPLRHRVLVGGATTTVELGAANVGPPGIPGNLYGAMRPAGPLPDSPSEPGKSQRHRFTSWIAAETASVLDDAVQLTVGFRRQQVVLDSFNPNTGAKTSTYDKSATTPILGLVVKPLGEQLSLYASYIEGLTRGNVVPLGTTYVNAGQILKPYKSKQREIGVKWDSGDFAVTLAYYDIRRPSYVATPVSGGLLMEPAGEQKNTGVEITAFGELPYGFRTLAGASFSRTEIVKANNGLNEGHEAHGSPRFQASAGLEWDVPPVPGLTLEARVFHIGSMYGTNANTYKIPSSTTADLGFRYRIEQFSVPMTFRLSVQNVADKAYYSGARAEGVFALGIGRTIKSSLSFDF